MRLLLLAFLATVPLTALAQPPEEAIPPACLRSQTGHIDWKACSEAAPRGSYLWVLALINLGTDAFMRNDYAGAVRFYDLAVPPGGQRLYADAGFHAFRGDAYDHVGRTQEGLADARIALQIMRQLRSVPSEVVKLSQQSTVDTELVYSLVLPMLKKADDPEFRTALEEFKALPLDDWVSMARRASVFGQLGDFSTAVELSERSMTTQSNNPMLQNNHCYILTRAGRATEAISYCERAARALPEAGAVRHSLASALAGAGQCVRAEAELSEARRLDPVSVDYRKPIPCTPSR